MGITKSIATLFFFLVVSNKSIYGLVKYFQKTFHLSGNLKENQESNYITINEYHPENTIGGISLATSFHLPSEELLVMLGKRRHVQESIGAYSRDFVLSSNQIWKYSLELNQWKFIKGDLENKKAIIDEFGVESSKNAIGSRYGAKGVIDNSYIHVFGGLCFMSFHYEYPGGPAMIETDVVSYSGLLWRLNLDTFNWTVIQGNSTNRPSGRIGHTFTRINEEEIFLFGGTQSNHPEKIINNDYPFSDGWILSTIDYKWKKVKEKINLQMDLNDYPSEGFGRKFHSAIKTSEERILIFGGIGTMLCSSITSFFLKTKRLNLLEQYNVTSNNFEVISGQFFWKDDQYEVNDDIITHRSNQGMWKFNDQTIVVVGGISKDGIYYKDEWQLDISDYSWTFAGKAASLSVHNKAPVVSQSYGFSDFTLFGAIANMYGHFLNSSNSLIMCGGYGYSQQDIGQLSDCYSIYYGSICFTIKDTNENVCSGKGRCIQDDTCECFDGYYGEQCATTMCNGIFSNSSSICSGNGICIDQKCACFDASIYTVQNDCSTNENIKALMDNIVLISSVSFSVLIIVFILIVIVVIIILVLIKMKKRLNRIDKIEGIEMILNEAELEQKSLNPKVKINKKIFIVEHKDINLLKQIGQGGSDSTIFLAEYKGSYCAYKSYHCRNLFQSEDSFQMFEKEVEVFSSFNHPSILQFFGCCVNPPKIGILMEYCKHGDITKFLMNFRINNKNPYPITKKLELLKQIASGMSYLHSNELIHRDLKPENILIDDSEDSKIMDFGLAKLNSKTLEQTMTHKIGTVYYMAPEVIKNGKYSNACDVFSFAILSLVVITENFLPFGKINGPMYMKRITNDSSFRPEIEHQKFKSIEFLEELITQNWDQNEKKRNSFAEIYRILDSHLKNRIPPKIPNKRPPSTKISAYEFHKKGDESLVEEMKIKLEEKEKEIQRLMNLLSKIESI